MLLFELILFIKKACYFHKLHAAIKEILNIEYKKMLYYVLHALFQLHFFKFSV